MLGTLFLQDTLIISIKNVWSSCTQNVFAPVIVIKQHGKHKRDFLGSSKERKSIQPIDVIRVASAPTFPTFMSIVS